MPLADCACKVINGRTGYIRDNSSWIIGRVGRDFESWMDKGERLPRVEVLALSAHPIGSAGMGALDRRCTSTNIIALISKQHSPYLPKWVCHLVGRGSSNPQLGFFPKSFRQCASSA
jgi:hypothetical protein